MFALHLRSGFGEDSRMNLLSDKWIPVRLNGCQTLITYEDLLTNNNPVEISLDRDDMELACLQLLIALTQVVFLPSNREELIERISKPLSRQEYKNAVEGYYDWFDLLHSDYPFMQIPGIESKDKTPIQKLFVGLPEGNNHSFFNQPGEVAKISLPMAAIALYNLASNSPSFGGGFKGGLRGAAPVTSLIRIAKSVNKDQDPELGRLRRNIWFNVLHWKSIRKLMPKYEGMQFSDYDNHRFEDKLTWLRPIKVNEEIWAHDIGLARGIFWQPAHILLNVEQNESVCDVLGVQTPYAVSSFQKEKFKFDVLDLWRHPHSPTTWSQKKDLKQEKYVSFTTTAPAWTKLNQFLLSQESEKDGNTTAAVIDQFLELTGGLHGLEFSMGGYRNKQSLVLERRHEHFRLNAGWENHKNDLLTIVELGTSVKTLLRKHFYSIEKRIGAKGIANLAERQYYRQTEHLIHGMLRDSDWQESDSNIKELCKQLTVTAMSIFDDVTHVYSHDPRSIKTIAYARKGLNQEFKKLKGDKS